MSAVKLIMAEPKHKKFIYDLFNSEHMNSKGVRNVSEETIDNSKSEGFYFNISTGNGFLVAIDSTTGEFVGALKVTTNLVHLYSWYSGGLSENMIGKTLGTVLFSLANQFLFMRYPIQRIEGNLLTTNDRSLKALKRSGFTVEGIKRKAWFVNGVLTDQYVVSIMRDEFIKMSSKVEAGRIASIGDGFM